MSKFAGAAIFVVTLAVALLATSYYNRRYAPPPPQPPPAATPAEQAPTPAATPPAWHKEILHKVRLVTLDVAARKSHTKLTVEHYPSAPAPERLWVWVAFFAPGDAAGEVFAGEPVLVEKPFATASAHRTTIDVTAACPWCGRRGVPAAGYYARVRVSAVSAEDARLADVDVSRDLATAVPVTVEEGR